MALPTLPTTFESVLVLARLPWFDVVGGNRLVLADGVSEEIGPIVDCHTHLAMSFLRRLTIDLHAQTPTTAYYLPMTQPIDLEAYANTAIDRASMFAMKLDLVVLGFTSQGMRTTHTAPNLIRDMRGLGIEKSVVLPIDLPVGHSNADEVTAATERYGELVAFGSVHPFDRNIDRRLDDQQAQGALGIKLHPNGQFIAPDHPRTVHLCGRCGQRGLPVMFHCGPVGIEPKAAERRSQVARYEATIAANPDTLFILGHSGALQLRDCVKYAERYDNTVFELASPGLPDIRHVLEVVPPDRIVFGTDWPFYHQGLTLARVLIATEGDDALRRAVLHDNAVRLLDLAT